MSYQASPTRYDTMPYRNCGRSGLKLPVLSLGLWQNFGASRDYASAMEILGHAFDAGITHFDLANNYGPPPRASEELMGLVMSRDFAPYRDELIISTKAGYRIWPGPYGEFGSRKNLLASLDRSLACMRLDYVDIFYSHRYDAEHAARGNDGRARARRAAGQSALCRHLELSRAADARRASHPEGDGRPDHPAPTELLGAQSLDREGPHDRCMRRTGYRSDRVLAALARRALGQVQLGCPGRHASGASVGHLAREPCRAARAGGRRPARRDRAREGTNAGAARARLGAAPSRDDLDGDRRAHARSTEGEPGRARQPRAEPRGNRGDRRRDQGRADQPAPDARRAG